MFGKSSVDDVEVPADAAWMGPRFEHRVVTLARTWNGGADALGEKLSAWGAQGWQVTGVVEGGVGAFKGTQGDARITVFLQRQVA